MIQLEDVSKKFKNVELFSHVNVTFEQGKKIQIKGVNGSGKSVLLKMIVGYSGCDEGSVIVDGKVIRKDVDFIPDAGVMINAPEFIGNMSGLDNLLYLADIRKRVTKEEVMQYVEQFGLTADIEKKYRTYSLGMKQKMRIIQAVMEKPSYLILDEPFDALDNKGRAMVIDILNDYMKSGERTLLFTSHMSETDGLADIVYEIEDKNLILRKG